MAKHPDAAVPEREQLACTLWKCDYRAMDLLSGGDGFGDGSVTWNTLQPVDRLRWIAAAQAFEDSHWLAARHDADIAAAKAALHDAEQALQYISSPTMGLPGGRDAEDYARETLRLYRASPNPATEADQRRIENALYALEICIGAARPARDHLRAALTTGGEERE